MDLRLPPGFKEFLRLLKDHKFRHLVICGLPSIRTTLITL
jgi:hypothetical protein